MKRFLFKLKLYRLMAGRILSLIWSRIRFASLRLLGRQV